MRYDVKKHLFVGHHAALEQFFQKAQNAGLVDFIDARKFKAKELPEAIQHILETLKVLRGLPPLTQKKPESYRAALPITEKVLKLNQAIEQMEEELRTTRLEIARMEVFGQFSFDDVRYIEEEGHKKVRFFFAKKGRVEAEVLPKEILHVASAHGLDYFVSISSEPFEIGHLFPMYFDAELSTLQRHAKELEWNIYQNEQELKTFSQYQDFLYQALTMKYNDYNLTTARTFAAEAMDGVLFSVEGWVSENKTEELAKVVEGVNVHIAPIAVEEGEMPPTYLENKGVNRVGEDLVNIYDTPSNEDRDPSLWVLISFAIFFAMIIRDGGYGLVFLAAALYYRYKKRQIRGSSKRLWKLGVILFSSCILWGALTHSFFGINFAPDSVVKKVSLLDWLVEKKTDYHFEKKDRVYDEWMAEYPLLQKTTTAQEFLYGAKKEVSSQKVVYKMHEAFTDEIMMELALLAGIIHISLSFLRYLDRNWSGVGWILTILGCYLAFPNLLHATSMAHYVLGLNPELAAQEDTYLIYAGLSLAVLLALIRHRAFGLLEITNLIQVFGDILSYLRLYALGLAGAIISGIVNDVASSIIVVLGIPLLILGHSLNMALCIIGGVIHGLRLNFIEWYHYSFDGGGKRFNPLRKMKVE